MNLDVLLAEREINRQLVGFARAMDERDWKSLDEITTDDIISSFGLGEIEGRSAMVDFIRHFLDGCGTTQHIIGNVLIDIDGDTATSNSYVSDMHVGKDENENLSFRTLGNYYDEWKRINGVWLMSRREKDSRATIGSIEALGVKPKSKD
ncbi:MAG: nuclear transport factor 2 family protein [Chloroflexi bacterium]|jgi:hypothetical protein|nr:nuclear transport factor 2 family protein [Chloroflexota bacterium]